MIIIFDLDYTLLDTSKFKKGLAKALNLTFDNFQNTCIQAFKKTTYNLEEHLEYLKKIGTISNISEVNEKLDHFYSNLNQYLFPQAEEILNKFKVGNKLVLLTYGAKKWQQKKIDYLNIKKYFDQIIIADEDKSKSLIQFQKNDEKILIINDKASEILRMKKILPNAEYFLIKGPYSNDLEHDLKEYGLNDLLNINVQKAK